MQGKTFFWRAVSMFGTQHAIKSASDPSTGVSTTSTSPATQSVSDACSALVSSSFSSPGSSVLIAGAPAVEACYKLFEVTPADRRQQTDALKGYFNVYPYKDIITDSKAPFYEMHFDLFAALDAIAANNSITDEFTLEMTIVDTLSRLQDGHVSYTPQCFNAFVFMQPFDLMPLYNMKDDKIEITVADLAADETAAGGSIYSKFWKEAFGTRKPADFLGAKLVSLNDQDPIDFLQVFADKYNGIAHAPEARFNSLFPSYNWPKIDEPILSSFSVHGYPNTPIKYVFELADKSIVNVTFEWVGILTPGHKPASFAAGAQSYYKDHCSTFAHKTATHHHFSTRRDKNLFAYHKSSSIKRDATDSSQGVANMAQPTHQDVNGAFFMLADGNTGVWMMSTFDPLDGSEAGLEKWVRNITTGLLSLEDQGAKRLIIDLSNNGGGFVCYGWGVLNYLFPNANLDHLHYTFRMTDKLADLLVSNNETADFMVGGETLDHKPITDYWNQIIEPGIQLPGFQQQYSNYFLNGCPKLTGLKPLKTGWQAKDILLVSNGVCGSTCAQVTTIMRNQLGVRAVTYGGGRVHAAPENRQPAFDPTSFAAGDVISFTDTLEFFDSKRGPQRIGDSPNENAESKLLPVKFKFPLKGGQMPFWTSMSTHSKYPNSPIEWIVDPSEFYLRDVLLNDPKTVWDGILRQKFFDEPFQPKAKHASFGVGRFASKQEPAVQVKAVGKLSEFFKTSPHHGMLAAVHRQGPK
ncbi:hypothetical protein BJ741DRAFT_622200 [Chytriomyces cf. hyalinus JEL632]|nr:hypothetical protein BJ741DRAFT_622200 [Chytriomyces cf. hyalinus JEL632]